MLMGTKKKLAEMSKKVVLEGYNRFPFEPEEG
jgi:hypothetical protein